MSDNNGNNTGFWAGAAAAVGAAAGAGAHAAIGGVGLAALGGAVGITLGPFMVIGATLGAAGYGLYSAGKSAGEKKRRPPEGGDESAPAA